MAIDDAHMKRIGRIAIEFGHLEWQVARVFVELLGADVGDIIAKAVDTFYKRRDLTVKLMNEKFPQIAEEWKKCMEISGELAKQRNEVIHQAWLFQDGDSMIGMPVKGTPNTYTIADLEALADKIHAMNDRVETLSGPVIAASMEDYHNSFVEPDEV